MNPLGSSRNEQGETAVTVPAPFPDRLEDALQAPLPGLAAQKLMAPPHRKFVPEPGEVVRKSSVLALLHDGTPTPYLLFTLRPSTLRHHAGEVCFPGGGMEPGDPNLRATALREVEEELGVPGSQIRILGELSPLYIAPSHNLVHPFVGWIARLPKLVVDRGEVERILQIPIATLLDPSARGTHVWEREGQRLTAPCYLADGLCIWGATAMIVSELLQVIQRL